jgi:hypothetical protein
MKNTHFGNIDIDYVYGLGCFFQVKQDKDVEVIQGDAIISFKTFSEDSFSFS